MAYVDQHAQFRFKPVVGVALVHLAIGYAFISGLASEAIKQVPAVFRLIDITEPSPPPPTVPDTPRVKADLPRSVRVPNQQVDRPLLPPVDAIMVERMTRPMPPQTGEVTPLIELPPPARSQAARATVRGNRSGWITADDYPPRALRNEEEGTVGISLRVGADGRVSECAVTASSGSPQLDETTCRLYPRRARFSPALDEAGRPVASTTTDRVRWTIPR